MDTTWFPELVMREGIWTPYFVGLVGFGVSSLLYWVLRIRTPGVVGAPLLAVYALVHIWIILVVAIIAVVLWGVSEVLQRRLIYGHRLFLILCGFSLAITFPVVRAAGIQVAFVASIIPAVFSYNYAVSERKGVLVIGIVVLEVISLLALGYILIQMGV